MADLPLLIKPELMLTFESNRIFFSVSSGEKKSFPVINRCFKLIAAVNLLPPQYLQIIALVTTEFVMQSDNAC